MKFSGFPKQPDINKGIEQYEKIPEAVLLDVRTSQEYEEGHIPGSINLPLQDIEDVEDIVENKDTPLFVHCRSGGRSRQAAAALEQMGYTNVINIGGIEDYTGKVER